MSSLALGRRGYVQVANYSVAGALYLAGAAGLSRAVSPHMSVRAVPTLIGAAAVGLLGSAVFTTDPVGGYPPGTPSVQAGYSTSGALHDAVAIPIFVGLPAAAIAQAWQFRRTGQRGWAVCSGGTALSMIVGLGCASAGFGQSSGFVRFGGLFQRLAVASGFAWLTALSARALRVTAAH